MSPSAAAEFNNQWPALRRRLEAFLRSKGVRNGDLDDLVQETAARLLSVWHRFDRGRPAWPLTVTIALNLLRDRSKKRDPELLAELPDLPASFDAAQIGLARIELAEVLKAIGDLTPSQRHALLQAIDSSGESLRSTSSEKMARMRARKRLADAVGRAGAGVTLKLRRTGDAVHALFTKTDVVQALACATCLFVTTAGAVSLYPQIGAAGSGQSRRQATFTTTVGPIDDMQMTATTIPSSWETTLAPRRIPAGAPADGAIGSGATSKAADEQAGGSATPGSSVPGSVTLPSGTVPTNAPLPAPPNAPDAPTGPPEAPALAPGASPDEGSPVPPPPSEDAPLQVLDETTKALDDVVN